jgi:hypothetical protein
MWLGVFAVIVAVSFALIKFLTGAHWRRLRERQARLQADLNKNRQRLQSLDGTLHVERGRKGAIEQKLKLGRRFKDELYHRLCLELPGPLVSEAQNCINHNPIPQPRGVRLFHELKIADQIAKTLQSMAVGLFEFSIPDEGTRLNLMDAFIEMLDEAEVSYIRGKPGQEDASASLLEEHAIVCAFDHATTCMELTRAFIQKAGGDVVGQVRAMLLAGVNTSRHTDDDVSRLFARALDQALEFITRSPDGSLLMNAVAYEDLGDTADGVKLFDKAEQLYVFAWQAEEEEAESAESSAPEATAAGEEPESEATVIESEQADVDTDVSTKEGKS